MAKKEKDKEVVFTTQDLDASFDTLADNTLSDVDEPLYEAEAYDNPSQDEDKDLTFIRPVGIGAPVPIIAPKHNHVQLQPIVVPLAVIPYMSQDTDSLYGRRDNGMNNNNTYPSQQGNSYPTDFSVEQKRKVQRSCKVRPRVFSLITLLLSLVMVVPFILSIWYSALGNQDMTRFGAINSLIVLATQGALPFTFESLLFIDFVLFMVMLISCALLIICALIGLIVGKYPRVFNGLFSVLGFGATLGVLIRGLVQQDLEIGTSIVFFVLIAVAGINAILSIIFSISLNRLDDKAEIFEQEF